ncbi:MAG: RDD family protein [Luteolibacter sp.]
MEEKLDTLQEVELAEGVEIRLRIAGPLLRGMAYGIDMLIRLVILIAAQLGISMMGLAMGNRVSTGLTLLMWFLLDWFYPVFFESGKHGATPGKRMMGLRVVQAAGSPITIGQAILRNFLRVVDGMPFSLYGLAMVSCLATRRFQRLGDLAAGTVVIYAKAPVHQTVPAPPPISPLPIGVKLTPDEVRALALFRERAGLWSDARRAEIADQAAVLSGATGALGVTRLMAMAHWIQERRRER